MQKYGLYLRPYFQNRCNTSTLMVGRRRTDYQVKYPCLEPWSFFIVSWRKLLKNIIGRVREREMDTMWWDAFSWIGIKFLLQKSFSSCCELFPNLKAASVILYLFLFSYKTSKRPPMAQSRILQVEKLKTLHSFLAVKELWQKIFTHQPLPVYSIKSIFFITVFLLSMFICCTRQEPEKGERAGVRSMEKLRSGSTPAPPGTLWGWSNSQTITSKVV